LQPAGIDSRFFYMPDSRQVGKDFEFVFAGSFSHRKGLDLLLTALGDARLGDARIVFVGTGPMRNAVATLRNGESVTLLDHLTQNEMREVFWRSKFIVLPSRSEPFGLVVSEAMFCGIPAIVSDEPGLEMQVANGRNGFVFANGDVAALTDCLAKAVEMTDGEYRKFSDFAASSNKDFDILNVINALVEIYSDLNRNPDNGKSSL
jgi:glycosyltransferase involved in cell wall biosynthesis